MNAVSFDGYVDHHFQSNSIRHNIHTAPNLRAHNENYLVYLSSIHDHMKNDAFPILQDINSEEFLISEMNIIILITTTSIILTESDLSVNRKVLNLDNSQENDDNGEENLIMIDFEDLNLSSLCQIIDIDECRVFAYTNYNGNGSLLSLKAECKHLCISGILFHTDNEAKKNSQTSETKPLPVLQSMQASSESTTGSGSAEKVLAKK
ncbi:hypothetical protein DINM_006860 [Dirofilaria immitis]|nr:hypothetical protein [Dirofilaria immitis]